MQLEIYKDIPGYEGLYQVSNFGNVKALSCRKKRGLYFQTRAEKILKPKNTTYGYLEVCLCIDSNNYSVGIHRLVALSFIPNPENKPTVNHKNGIKNDNKLENLEWATFKEQINHADSTGLRDINGENHKRSKLKEADIIDIRTSEDHWKILAEKYSVNKSCIFKIRARIAWRHIA